MHDCCSAVAKESGLGTSFSVNDDSMFRVGIVIRRDGRMVGHLFCNVIGLRSIFEFVSASEEFAKNWIVWLLDTLEEGPTNGNGVRSRED